jgi:hypothetical protein
MAIPVYRAIDDYLIPALRSLRSLGRDDDREMASQIEPNVR